ncbi:hypothetical protein D3C86_1772330 [compost metagenome]
MAALPLLPVARAIPRCLFSGLPGSAPIVLRKGEGSDPPGRCGVGTGLSADVAPANDPASLS